MWRILKTLNSIPRNSWVWVFFHQIQWTHTTLFSFSFSSHILSLFLFFSFSFWFSGARLWFLISIENWFSHRSVIRVMSAVWLSPPPISTRTTNTKITTLFHVILIHGLESMKILLMVLTFTFTFIPHTKHTHTKHTKHTHYPRRRTDISHWVSSCSFNFTSFFLSI
jgi:hypothetical protein